MTKKFEVLGRAEIFIHNDLANTAHYFRAIVAEKAKNEQAAEGISLDITAALVFLAFSLEAKVNFIGWKCFEDGWPEKASFWEKVNLVSYSLQQKVERGSEPWQTIAKLKRLRDTLAHGQPDIKTVEEIIEVGDDEAVDIFGLMKAKWEDQVTIEFLERATVAVEDIWKVWCDKAKIEVFQTLTTAEQSTTLIKS